MKKSVLLIFAFAAVLLCGISALAQNEPGGPAKPKVDNDKKESAVAAKWDVVISAPGQDYAGTLKIEKSGDAYKGSVTTELGEAPLTNIKVDADSFTASIAVNAQGQTLEGTMNGKVKDDKISGTIELAGVGSIPYSGKKP